MINKTFALALMLAAPATLAFSQGAMAQAAKPSEAAIAATVNGSFSGTTEEWRKRIEVDETQRICTEKRNQVSAGEADAIQKREAKTVPAPADGKYLGDWKKGFRVANVGTGGQFSDKPGGPVGGNCYACHELAPTELSYGTLGPSLKGYGKVKDFSEDAIKEAWAKIWNSQSVFACSNMPRFGAKKILNEEQIKDVLAYLFDKDSPVNK